MAIAPLKKTTPAADGSAALCEAQLRLLLDGVNDVITILDADGRIIFVNAAVERVFGSPREKVLGGGFHEWVHPDDLHMAVSAMQTLLSEPGSSQTSELRAIDVNGNVREVRSVARNLLHDPVLRGIVITTHDVTERNAAARRLREREQAYASLLSNLPGMGYRRQNDESWSMDVVTDGCRALTGHEPEQLRTGGSVAYADLIHPDEAEPLWEKCRASLAARRTCSNEYRIKTQSGEWRWVLDIAHGVYADDGELLSIEGFVIDVTEKKRLEEQLSHSQRLEGIGRLAGGIAHDFNNLLAVVMSYTELASAQLESGARAKDDLSQVLDATHRAKELTHQLLAFASEQMLEPKALDLASLTRDLERLLRRVLGEDIRLQTRIGGDLWAVWADQGQMGQVLLNLAVNARDAMPQGGELSIEVANRQVIVPPVGAPLDAKPGDYVILTVQDTGIGMTEEVMKRIFEPFFSTKGDGRGSGLGLATVYGIVKQVGGFIMVDSAPGLGSEFRVFFPRSLRAVSAAESVIPAATMAAEQRRILLVEDDPTVRRATKRMLKLLGYDVLSAESGESALRLLAESDSNVDLILTDIVMRGMSGTELVVQLRSAKPDLPVLFMSGYPGDSAADLTSQGQRAAFLPKPFTVDVLAQKISGLFSGPD